MKFTSLLGLGLLSLTLPLTALADSNSKMVGLDTNGAVFELTPKTGALVNKHSEQLSSYDIGASARRGSLFHFVAVPSGGSENAIFTTRVKQGTTTQVDLDRGDSVKAMFFSGKTLFGIFYDALGGTSGLYRINPSTGVTTLVLDLSALDVEPVPGSIAQFGKFFYMLVKPEIDSTRRQLLRFKTRAGSAALFEVADALSAPVLCDHLKANTARKDFVCLASAAENTQVNVCRLSTAGRARCLSTLPGIERVGSGHSMLTPDEKSYFALAYVPGEPNNQHLIRFTAKGALRSNVSIPTISLGAHFESEFTAAK